MTLHIRAWQAGDEARIMESFNAAFGEQRDADYWRWKYLHDGQALAWLSVDEHGRVLTQLAAHPVRWQSANGPLRVGHAGDAFALRLPVVAHGRTMLKTIAAFHRAQQAQGHLALLFGFPSATLQGLHATMQALQGDEQPVRRWEWAGLGLSEMESVRGQGPLPQGSLQQRVPVRDGLPSAAALDTLWQRCAPRYALACPRDSDWVSWRFVQRPDVRDYHFLHCVDTADQLCAWVVLRVLGGVLWVADLLWSGDEPVLQALLAACRACAAQRGCARMALWLQGDATAIAVLQRSGWRDTSAAHPVRLFLHCYDKAPQAAWVRSALYLTKADSDLI